MKSIIDDFIIETAAINRKPRMLCCRIILSRNRGNSRLEVAIEFSLDGSMKLFYATQCETEQLDVKDSAPSLATSSSESKIWKYPITRSNAKATRGNDSAQTPIEWHQMKRSLHLLHQVTIPVLLVFLINRSGGWLLH
eukprot:scaffold3515_cov126-Cylindrotheca_fusiformis.AAC.34